MQEWRYNPGTGWRYVVSFMNLPLPPLNNPLYLLHMIGGSQMLVWMFQRREEPLDPGHLTLDKVIKKEISAPKGMKPWVYSLQG
jgi:hypothetical protein